MRTTRGEHTRRASCDRDARRPGLLLALTLSFVQQGLEIAASDVRTDQGVASDRFTLRDASGKQLSAERLADIQRRVIAALKTETEPEPVAESPASQPRTDL